MEIDTRVVYAIIVALLVCHIVLLLFQRRINARQLPPRFFTLGWTSSTSLDATHLFKLQQNYGKTYRLS